MDDLSFDMEFGKVSPFWKDVGRDVVFPSFFFNRIKYFVYLVPSCNRV